MKLNEQATSKGNTISHDTNRGILCFNRTPYSEGKTIDRALPLREYWITIQTFIYWVLAPMFQYFDELDKIFLQNKNSSNLLLTGLWQRLNNIMQ